MQARDLEGLLPPHNLEAEEAVIGALLIDPNAILRVADLVKPADFYMTPHRLIFEAASVLHRQEQPIDLMTVSGWLADAGKLEKVGGKTALIGLFDGCVSSANVDAHAKLVASKAKRRQWIAACQELARLAQDRDLSDEQLRAAAEQRLFDLMTEQATDRGLVHISEFLTEEVSQIERLSNGADREAFETGFYDLDELSLGLQPGKLYVVAGRPGMGKSAFTGSVLVNIANRYGKSCALFSLEMQGGEVGRRMLSAESSIDSSRIMKGQIQDVEWESLGSAFNRLLNLPIWVNDRTTMTPNEVKSQALKLKAKTGSLACVVVDYLHLMIDGDEDDTRTLTRYTRQFKRMAGELHCPIVLLSQLNRAVEGQSQKRPTNKDLRQSGSIEQDADQIWMLYRDEVYNPDTSDRGVAEVIVTKHRGGPTGTAKLLFEGEYTRFRNLARMGQ